MKYSAISLWQPYASLIAANAKPYETRHWAPSPRFVGKRIAIHAAARKLTRAELDSLYDEVADALGFCHWHMRIPYGAVLGTALLAGAYKLGFSTYEKKPVVGHVPGSKPLDLIQADAFGDYEEGRWCWRLEDFQSLPEPALAKGKQGWWQWEIAA